MDLIHYDCMTAAGPSVQDLMQGLYSGQDHSTPLQLGGRVCYLKNRARLAEHFDRLWTTFYEGLTNEYKNELKKSNTLLLFSSTKGSIEDYIWDQAGDLEKMRQHADPFEKIVDRFSATISGAVTSIETLVVSNACASSHVAFEVAQVFLNGGDYDFVFVIAADLIGPFIHQGFRALKILSGTTNKPFDRDRDGLQLGEALALLLFTKQSGGEFRISSVASETEAGSVTAPSMNGDSLKRVLKKVMNAKNKDPDFLLAHATGTRFNDLAEAKALRLFHSRPPVLGIKWSVGHTLGASGALDLIVACEVIKRQKLFRIANTQNFDPEFELNFSGHTSTSRLNSAVVSSLGFGGIHAALQVEKGES